MRSAVLLVAMVLAGCGGDPSMMGDEAPGAGQGGAGGEEVITAQGGQSGATAGLGGAQAALGGAGGDHAPAGAGGSQAGGAPGAGGRSGSGGAMAAGGSPGAGGSSPAPKEYPTCRPEVKTAMTCVYLDAKGFEVWGRKDGWKCAACRDAANQELTGCTPDPNRLWLLCVHSCTECPYSR